MSRLAAIAIVVVAACAPPAPPATPVANAAKAPVEVDFAAELRAIGHDEDQSEQLAIPYVKRGPEAIRAAATVVLDEKPGDLDRGARYVLMSLESAADFAFIASFHPTPSKQTTCGLVTVLFLLRQSAQQLDPSWLDHTDRIRYVPYFARRLVSVLDEPWPTCESEAPGLETGYTHPHVMALEILDEMVDWSPQFDGSLARSWDSSGPTEIRAFRTWWAAHASAFER